MAPAAGCNGCVEGKSRVCRNTTTGDNVGNREDGGICFDIQLVSNSKSLFYHCTQRRRFLAEGGIVSDSTASAGFSPFYWVLKKGKEIEKKEMEGISQHRFPWLAKY